MNGTYRISEGSDSSEPSLLTYTRIDLDKGSYKYLRPQSQSDTSSPSGLGGGGGGGGGGEGGYYDIFIHT